MSQHGAGLVVSLRAGVNANVHAWDLVEALDVDLWKDEDLLDPKGVVTAPVKRRLMDAQHPGESFADYELDHLIPISFGGAPLDLRDLWLQPRRGQANAADKNALAYVLWRLVCERRVSLRTAQQAIRRDWTKAYDTYATPENVARYHFAHRQEERD